MSSTHWWCNISECCHKGPVPSICKAAVKIFESCYGKQWLTAAHVVSSVVNLSSVLYCLHMATRPCSLESLSSSTAANAYMTAVSIGSRTVGLFASSQTSITVLFLPFQGLLPESRKSDSFIFLMSLPLIIEWLQCRCWKKEIAGIFTNKAHNSARK